ncbi:putative 43 kDa receptor-associated protein of the synapse-like protein [Hypsibius exemplaris]|uniref:43 kDa receptor-associated protein of the synapse-like protein n=1 Tax=Hypsibius exemplaris TaxID=2072580 RepID=A0A1W0X4Q9_HYPEX|nr:putative 43 kDa receptor-associated protein of the synapse-like protein [Hypsibius exemplaris]
MQQHGGAGDLTLQFHKKYPGELPQSSSSLSRFARQQRTAQEQRLLAYCLKANLQSTTVTSGCCPDQKKGGGGVALNNPNSAGNDANEKERSDCFLYLSECLMGGLLARHRIQAGIRNYKLQDYQAAYREWVAATRLCDNRELFHTLNYLISLSFDFGHFQKMLALSVQQFQIGRFLNERALIAESYLNLATSRGLLCNWELCLSYCKNCLLYLDATKVGYVYMSIACSYLEMNQFSAAIGFLKLTFDICSKHENQGLVVQALVACSGMFLTLKSYPEAREFAMRAIEVAETVFSVGPASCRYRRTKVHVIPVQIKLRQLDDAFRLCEESVRSSLEYHDRYVQAKCLLFFADIHRLKSDYEVAYQSYQAAADSGYQQIQLKALVGMAKSVIKLSPSDDIRIRQNKAMGFYNNALELATTLGCKLEIFRLHRRMAKLQSMLEDHPDEVDRHLRSADGLSDEMQLFCDLCGSLYGLKRSQLKALSCGHIYHTGCLLEKKRPGSSQYFCTTCRCFSEDICESFLSLA